MLPLPSSPSHGDVLVQERSSNREDDTHHLELHIGNRLLGLERANRDGLMSSLERECRTRGFTYERDGQEDVIPYGAVPIVMTEEQAEAIHSLAMAVRRCMARLPDLWLADEAARSLLPLAPAEQEWLRETWTPEHHANQGIVSRLDADIKLAGGSIESTRFFEYNGVAVGGLYYAHVAESLCEQVVIPALGLEGFHRGPQLPTLMLQEIQRVGRAIGRAPRRVGIIENREWDSGITEAPQYAKIFGQNGSQTRVLDPRDLELRNGEIYHRGDVIDFFYRHMEVRDLVELEVSEGRRLDAMRHAFHENRVVSSLSGEFDHKACWEVVDDPAFAGFFTPADRDRILRYLPWTRVVRPARTRMPDGHEGDLLEEIRSKRESYVLKPNRECGGIGVMIGMRTSAAEWEAQIEQALAMPGEWVAQSFIQNASKRLPVSAEDAVYSLVDRYIAYGFAATEDGLGCLGRFSSDRVVNVSQGGGILPVMRVR